MNKKLSILLVSILTFLLVGCNVASVSLMDNRNATNNHISRSAKLWSGTTLDSITIEEANTEIIFSVDMEKGEVTFTIENEDGEVYTLSKTEAGTATDTFVIEEAGTYQFKEEGSNFSGSYEVTWGQKEAE